MGVEGWRAGGRLSATRRWPAATLLDFQGAGRAGGKQKGVGVPRHKLDRVRAGRPHWAVAGGGLSTPSLELTLSSSVAWRAVVALQIPVRYGPSVLCLPGTAQLLSVRQIERFGGMGMKVSTIERLIADQVAPDDVTAQATLKLHLQRYEFAAKHLKPGRLLDIACGVGYGTHLIAEKASDIAKAIGVDLSQQAIEYARQHYASGRVQFQQHDAMTFADDRGFDSIVSVETLEHVPDPSGLINHLVGLLRSDGVFIASVPTIPSMDVNHDKSSLFSQLQLHS